MPCHITPASYSLRYQPPLTFYFTVLEFQYLCSFSIFQHYVSDQLPWVLESQLWCIPSVVDFHVIGPEYELWEFNFESWGHLTSKVWRILYNRVSILFLIIYWFNPDDFSMFSSWEVYRFRYLPSLHPIPYPPKKPSHPERVFSFLFLRFSVYSFNFLWFTLAFLKVTFGAFQSVFKIPPNIVFSIFLSSTWGVCLTPYARC